MKTYARIYEGEVVEIIEPAIYQNDSPKESPVSWSAGEEIPVDRRFTTDFCASLVDVTSADPIPAVGWGASNIDGTWSFTAAESQASSS
ncbi:hypothetical protein [Burkholderia vietnamiensis]|uniref:hypothetical protein n=1 Tax=Burkholderia vietnamiensis TaxID=60552 RepID=UPI0012DA263C|nr:hypothetical protein [Burkholderia vietnamiensis]HDR8930256.1 hypothetical protein [Burkholderia vietnamiensis]